MSGQSLCSQFFFVGFPFVQPPPFSSHWLCPARGTTAEAMAPPPLPTFRGQVLRALRARVRHDEQGEEVLKGEGGGLRGFYCDMTALVQHQEIWCDYHCSAPKSLQTEIFGLETCHDRKCVCGGACVVCPRVCTQICEYYIKIWVHIYLVNID